MQRYAHKKTSNWIICIWVENDTGGEWGVSNVVVDRFSWEWAELAAPSANTLRSNVVQDIAFTEGHQPRRRTRFAKAAETVLVFLEVDIVATRVHSKSYSLHSRCFCIQPQKYTARDTIT